MNKTDMYKKDLKKRSFCYANFNSGNMSIIFVEGTTGAFLLP